MEKFAILFFIFLSTTPIYSVALETSIELDQDTLTLWKASYKETNSFTSCEEVGQIGRFCDSDKTKISEEEWDRPFIKSMTRLIDYYEPFQPVKVRSEEYLINRFLDQFITSEVGTRLYFALDLNRWEFPEEPDERTDTEKEEDTADDIENYNMREYYIRELINYLKTFEHLQEEDWWMYIVKKYQTIKQQIWKDHIDPECDTGGHQQLIRRQVRKFKPLLSSIWFGNNNFPHNARSIGFRSVYVGEKKKWDQKMRIDGFHNWYQFQRLLCDKNHAIRASDLQQVTGNPYFRLFVPLYKPPRINQPENELVRYCKIQFEYNGLKKLGHSSTILFGSPPEYDLAAFTLCYYRTETYKNWDAYGMGKCTTHLGNAAIVVVKDKTKTACETRGYSKLKSAFYES